MIYVTYMIVIYIWSIYEDVRYIYIIYTYIMEYYSAIKKNEILPFAVIWMDLEGIILSELSHTEKDKYYKHLYVESKYNKQVNTTKRKQTYRYREQTTGYQ